jgi:hypothetical protein
LSALGPSPHLVSRLGGQLRGAPLLPGLVQLKISNLDAQASSLLPLLLHPYLESLDLSESALEKPHVLNVILPSLPLDVAGLKHLSLHQSGPGHKLPLSAIEIIPQFPSIESVEIASPGTMVPHDLLRKIASHSPLKKISLHIKFEAIPPLSATLNANTGFFPPRLNPGLKSVTITLQHDLGSPPDFLAQKATSLIILVNSFWFPWLFQFQSVKAIRIAPSPGHQAASLQFSSLASALANPAVEEVMVETESLSLLPGQQGDAGLRQIVDTVARPHALTFGGMNNRRRPVRTLVLPAKSPFPPSLQALSYVSTHAVGLERLALAIDSSLASFNATKIPSAAHHQSSLLRLEISDLRPATAAWSLMDHSHIALYLDRIFPNLESIKVYRDHSRVARQEEHWTFIEHLRKEKKVLRLYQEGKL